ncbi:VIT1/CCC1 transporter family protein [Rhizobium subbaraonis]|nr:VIT family protein [Rhizobium subbaraonis]
MKHDPPPAAVTRGEAATVRAATSRRVLDPVARASEVLFGLIMVLTFTLSLAAAGAGRADVPAVLLGALGCNLAWAIIDAAMYLMGVRGERRLAISTIQAIRGAESPEVGRAIVAENIPPAVLPALTTSDLDRIRLHLSRLPPETLETRFNREDYLAALGVFLLVFLCLFPVAAPFLLFADLTLALRLSNIVAVAMLFLTGFTFGRQVGRPWRGGFLMVAIGVALVAVALALGG